MAEHEGLPDLLELRERLEEDLVRIKTSNFVTIEKAKLQRLVNLIEDDSTVSRYNTVTLIGDHTLAIESSSGQHYYISVQELPRLVIAAPYYEALSAYTAVVDLALSSMGVEGRTSSKSLVTKVFEELPWVEGEQGSEEALEFISRLLSELKEKHGYSTEDVEKVRRFLTEGEWSGIRGAKSGKKLNRNDFGESAIISHLGLLAAASSGRMPIVKLIPRSGIRLEDFTEIPKFSVAPVEGRVTGGQNVIYFGAPGTGKSYSIEQRAERELARVFRTVFHADLHSSDFIGGLKPHVTSEKHVTYQFQPGPFSEAWKFAVEHPNERVFLIIEELNRANASAVLADVFVLLDRDRDGTSRYQVEYPTEEFRAWATQTIEAAPSQLYLPSNLWIYATINSSDQGVYHLDTAFRRRWQHVHTAIRYDLVSRAPVRVDAMVVEWRTFLQTLNEFLLHHLDVDEERLIGAFFHELPQSSYDGAPFSVPDKILSYLWTDILRHRNRDTLFAPTVSSMGAALAAASSELPLFSDAFMTELRDAIESYER